MILRIRILRNRWVRRFRIKRFIWRARLLSFLDDMREWKARKPRIRLYIRIIRVSNNNKIKVRIR
jgi:hypothetical protein